MPTPSISTDSTVPVSAETLDHLMTHIGGKIDDTATAWIAVAMECLDQAGLSAKQQERVQRLLRETATAAAYPEGQYP